MTDFLSGIFGEGGPLQTGSMPTAAAQKTASAYGPEFAEKGSILGMTPSAFANIAGTLGGAIGKGNHIAEMLGKAASGWGAQKIAQLQAAKKEKDQAAFLKQLIEQMGSRQAGQSVGGVNTGIARPADVFPGANAPAIDRV